ncbi:hypothetical protein ACMV5I_28700, partial [Serratia sp. T13T92]|uniref:hypothetical protein n=1 Tax=Serratia sp. T13T92 TaxID=3397496 RepID=UPI0039DF44A6
RSPIEALRKSEKQCGGKISRSRPTVAKNNEPHQNNGVRHQSDSACGAVFPLSPDARLYVLPFDSSVVSMILRHDHLGS